ncbi:hypothetical protein KOR34_14840 [Posidoniimonas corsicana]|uniref:Uncharacterized protein n=1 Tax=Posidoniimonas corsicana TaxID=1938618 RepID=A0A5C5VDA9_9BACT|nr:DUF5695 domain-containing protein [Posidoniimonas corsicana]TWT36578.1 hypothetical protein KOR34_14840 [Posidoniimonas corsicana]
MRAPRSPQVTLSRPSTTAVLLTLCTLSAGTCLASPSETFKVEWSDGAIVDLRRVDDAFDTPYIRSGARLGDVDLRLRKPGGEWRSISTSDLAEKGATQSNGGASERTTTYAIPAPKLNVTIAIRVATESIDWTVTLENTSEAPIEVGDLAFPLPMNTRFARGSATTSVLKHSFVSGHGSFFFWMRSNSVGPYLTMTPIGDTALEYWDVKRGLYRAYAHSGVIGPETSEQGGKWRQPHTTAILQPKGARRSKRTYSFRFQWADDYDHVRDLLVQNGLVDIHVAPGMTIPSDLHAELALRCQHPIALVEAEFPEETQIDKLPPNGDYSRWRVKFGKLGENRLKVSYGDGRHVYLEYFSTEPLETLIKKRASFIARCQHLDPSKWYHGLISEWNMESGVLLGPDNYDRIKGWRIYEVTCDDPGLCKPAFLAAKNSEYPDQREVTALDDYVEHFVWGGLQRTTTEPYSYGIYGIPDWKQNRESDDPGEKGQQHLWRTYDYPHIVLIYYHMHRLARDFPNIRTRLTAEEYLQRAFGTAWAMFTVPWDIVQWSGYPTGYYNELVLVDLIDALERAGRQAEARLLRQCWAHKAEQFVNGKIDLFQSEYAFDSTGFESTHALAKYAVEQASASAGTGESLGYTRQEAKAFMEKQLAANLFCRGVIEPAYYYLGSDYRGRGGDGYTLSYMAQMGGWSVLDYGLYYADEPAEYLRLGYTSYLSSWALMNSGTPESNYGYWYPGKQHDGAAGGGFEPALSGETWLNQPHHRGAWYYACEIDLGYCGALRSAATVLADDPIFGRFCFGGALSESDGKRLRVEPRDGLRRRFHALLDDRKLHLLLETDRFQSGEQLELSTDLSSIAFRIESDNPVRGSTPVTVSLPQQGLWRATAGGKTLGDHSCSSADSTWSFDVPVLDGGRSEQVIVRRVDR